MMTYKNNFLIILTIFLFQVGFSQEIIEIENPSYEGIPYHSTVANDWLFCTFENQSPPDIQPGSFGVEKKAFDGNTYAGLVTRADGTFEMLQKKLEKPLEEGTCYSWNFCLSQSANYESISRVTLKNEFFNASVNVVVYGGHGIDCTSIKPLVRAEDIKGLEEWKSYQFIFEVKEAYDHLVIAVETKNLKNPKNGHILIDYFTPLIPIDCETNKPKNVVVKKGESILKDINLKKGEERLKALIEKIDINQLTKNGYLDYQFYINEEGKTIYDNIYFKELMKAFPKGDEREIILMTKDKFEGKQVMNYLKSYIEQKGFEADFLMLPHKEKLLAKYKESHTLLFDGKDAMLFVK